jgi:hypothetical protein
VRSRLVACRTQLVNQVRDLLAAPMMAQPVRPASSEPDGAGPFKTDDLMRRRSADSIMARAEHPSTR